jgi:CBS domain-containing protein
MKSVKSLLEGKGYAVLTVSPDTSAYEALKLMGERNVGALIVTSEGKPVGVVSERDFARKLFLLERSPREVPVKEVMTSPVVYVRPEQTNEECMALMTDKRIRHLPVLDGERLIGVVSIGDLVKDVISEQQFIISQLEHYITR